MQGIVILKERSSSIIIILKIIILLLIFGYNFSCLKKREEISYLNEQNFHFLQFFFQMTYGVFLYFGN